METEIKEVEAARELLSDLRELLPELLTRCQQVGKGRATLLANAGSSEEEATRRVKTRLAAAELERDALRQHILERVEASGEAVAEVRRIVTACVSLDNVSLEKPLSVAIPEFCKSVPARRKALLNRLKQLRNTRKIVAFSDTKNADNEALAPTSDSCLLEGKEHDASLADVDVQIGIIKQHLRRLYKLLGKLEQCTRHLRRVKDERYIARYESERAGLKNEQELVRNLLQNWVERNEQHGGRAWALHGETASAMVAALAEDIEDPELTAAMREDLAPVVDVGSVSSVGAHRSRAGKPRPRRASDDRSEAPLETPAGSHILFRPAARSRGGSSRAQPPRGKILSGSRGQASRRVETSAPEGLSIAGLGL